MDKLSNNKYDLEERTAKLVEAKDRVPGQLEQIATGAKEVDWMGKDQLIAYWRDNISYQLDEHAKAGLMLYYTKCFECGLIGAVPTLHFIEVEDLKAKR